MEGTHHQAPSSHNQQPVEGSDLDSDPMYDSSPVWFNASSFLFRSEIEAYNADLNYFAPLEALAMKLRAHSAHLNSELADLSNRDYAGFVSPRMRAIVVEFMDKATAFHNDVDSAFGIPRKALRDRARAAAAMEVMELLIDTSNVIFNVEKLTKEAIDETSLQRAENETIVRETQCILFQRIAGEMHMPKFLIHYAAKEDFFIENMVKGIQCFPIYLDDSLRHYFVNGLEHRDENTIYKCLRVYAAMDSTSSAEEIFRTDVVAPLFKKIISDGQIQVVDGASSDELEEDYRQFKQLIEKDCKFLLKISDRTDLAIFDFLANSIVKEVISAIQKGKPRVFSPRRLTEFVNNYKSSLSFVAFLEGYCQCESSVSKIQSDIMRQWNVEDYFTLRLQEIARSLDSALKGYAYKMKLPSRSSTFLYGGLVGRKMDDKHTNTTTSSEWDISDDLRDFIYVMRDVRCLHTDVCFVHKEHMGDYRGDAGLSEVRDLVNRKILQAKQSLEECLPVLIDTMIEAIARESVMYLWGLKELTLRCTGDTEPNVHSRYVLLVLRPLETFFFRERHCKHLTRETIKEVLLGAAERITSHYYEVAADVVNQARLLSQWRAEFFYQLHMQLFLDIEAYKVKLVNLDIDVTKFRAYRSLLGCAVDLV